MALEPRDLGLVLALVRGGTLGAAGQALGMDTSSVYRALKRLEQKLRVPLFDRSHAGVTPGELALALARHAAAMEAELDAARELLGSEDHGLSGVLRVTSTDIAIAGLLLPLLSAFRTAYPQLRLELIGSNQLARLDRREADVALRGTNQPPEHLVGVRLGVIRSALWAHSRYLEQQPPGCPVEAMDWASPDADETLRDFPSKGWRQRAYPRVVPALHLDGMLAVAHAIEAGVCVGVAPYFLMQGKSGLVDLSGELPAVRIELWLLTHPDMRHLRRVRAFFDFVRERLTLP